jgi:hypothetical protein
MRNIVYVVFVQQITVMCNLATKKNKRFQIALMVIRYELKYKVTMIFIK